MPRKLLVTILLNRIQPAWDKHRREEQHEFWPNRSYANLVFTLRTMIKEANEWHNKLYLVFIDDEKA